MIFFLDLCIGSQYISSITSHRSENRLLTEVSLLYIAYFTTSVCKLVWPSLIHSQTAALAHPICDSAPQNQSYGSILWNWDIYTYIQLSIDVLFVMIGWYLAEIHMFENLESEGFKKYIILRISEKCWENHNDFQIIMRCPNQVLNNT